MLQREIGVLAALLLQAGYRVMIETSGSHPVDSLPAGVVRIIDVKTPGSGESASHALGGAGRPAAAGRGEVRAFAMRPTIAGRPT